MSFNLHTQAMGIGMILFCRGLPSVPCYRVGKSKMRNTCDRELESTLVPHGWILRAGGPPLTALVSRD